MNKAAKILTAAGIAVFAASVIVIIVTFSLGGSAANGLVFEKTVTAQITDTRVIEHTKSEKKKGGTGYTETVLSRSYEVTFSVLEDGNSRTEWQSVPKSLYDEYAAFEKNKDMEFNLYRNMDGGAFLSLNGIDGATEEYQSGGQVTDDMGITLIVSMVTAFFGLAVMAIGSELKKH